MRSRVCWSRLCSVCGTTLLPTQQRASLVGTPPRPGDDLWPLTAPLLHVSLVHGWPVWPGCEVGARWTCISTYSCCSCACSEVSLCGAAGMPRPSGQRGTRQWGARWVACDPRHVCPVQEAPAVPAGKPVASACVYARQSPSPPAQAPGQPLDDILASRNPSRSCAVCPQLAQAVLQPPHSQSVESAACLLPRRRGLPPSAICAMDRPWRTRQAGPHLQAR